MRRRLFSLALCSLVGAGLVQAGVAAPPSEAGSRWPAYVLELPATVSSVFVAETGAARILRFDRRSAGIEAGYEAYMSIGENGTGKLRAWDRKTPLGIYFVVDQLDTSRLHEKYGAMAFPLDYPNTLDRLRGRTGDGIWVHGVADGNGRRPPRDTDGCLALPNDDLSALESSFVPNATPVIVTPSIAWRDDDERAALVRTIKDALRGWQQAQESGNVDGYLSSYSADFEYFGLARDEWAAYRRASIIKRPALSIGVDDLVLLADPVDDGLFLARFRHTVTTGTGTTVTTKRLYWKRQDDGSLRIVAEDNG